MKQFKLEHFPLQNQALISNMTFHVKMEFQFQHRAMITRSNFRLKISILKSKCDVIRWKPKLDFHLKIKKNFNIGYSNDKGAKYEFWFRAVEEISYRNKFLLNILVIYLMVQMEHHVQALDLRYYLFLKF